jgi:TetR/AcrR family transcriptional repressor of nem operon
MPREKQYNETELIERAMHAFWARGYKGTSIGDLVEATGIKRGSLYAAYDGKRSLFMAALRHYDRLHRRDFLARFSQEHAPKEAIIALFDVAATSIQNDENPAGCLLVNTAIELSPHDAEIAGLIQSSFDAVESFFGEMIESAKRDRTVSPSIQPGETAKALLGLFLGLRVLARSNADHTTKQAIIAQARRMLD